MSVQFASGMRLTPARLNAPIPVMVVKGASETLQSSASMQDDNELFVATTALAVYDVQAGIVYNSGTTPKFKIGFTFPTGATMTWFGTGLTIAATTFTGDLAANAWTSAGSGSSIAYAGAASDVGVRLFGRLTTSTTAGSLRIQWAQNTSTASDTIVRAGSWLTVQRTS